jgi:hypothetical protein
MPKKRNTTESRRNFKRGNRDHTLEKTPARVYANATKTKEKIDKKQERKS